MIRALGAAILASLAFAAPALALDPPPTVITFDGGTFDPNVFSLVEACPQTPVGTVQPTGGWDGRAFLHIRCGNPQLRISQLAGQHVVEFLVRAPAAADSVFVVGCDDGFCDNGPSIDSHAVALPANTWVPVKVEDGPGLARITNVLVQLTPQAPMDIDDVAFAKLALPDTAISGAAPSFTLSSNAAGASFRCALDGGAFAPCASPLNAAGAAPGTHTLTVVATDVYGVADASPATLTFAADRDGDAVPDTADNCLDTANRDQADTDKDGVGNACDLLPPPVPPVAGVSAVARVLSGEVFVKLPARTTLGFAGLRAPFQASGFVPLKGIASLPVGSTVDATNGELQLASAGNGFAPASRRALTQTARIRAGIFAIQQAKLKKRARKSAKIATDLALVSPAGAEAACAHPSKGTVRGLTVTVKGLYHAIGGASTATATNASFATSDRCDGTLTQVGRGKVTLKVKGRKRAVTVKAGRAFFAKARLFAVKKGRAKSR